MRRRNRAGLKRIGVLAMALLLALGAMGVGYAMWYDDLYIRGYVGTGSTDAGLACADPCCSVVPATANTSIGCTKTASMTLDIKVTNAQYNITPSLNPRYYCDFNVSNTGTLPIKIQSVTLAQSDTSSDPYPGVSAAIIILPDPTMLDYGETTTTAGKVHIYLTSEASVGLPLEYTLTATVLLWNQ